MMSLGQQVRRALDAPEPAVDGFGDDPGGRGLGQPGHALDQDVPAGEQADQQRFAQVVLSDDLGGERFGDGPDDAPCLVGVAAVGLYSGCGHASSRTDLGKSWQGVPGPERLNTVPRRSVNFP